MDTDLVLILAALFAGLAIPVMIYTHVMKVYFQDKSMGSIAALSTVLTLCVVIASFVVFANILYIYGGSNFLMDSPGPDPLYLLFLMCTGSLLSNSWIYLSYGRFNIGDIKNPYVVTNDKAREKVECFCLYHMTFGNNKPFHIRVGNQLLIVTTSFNPSGCLALPKIIMPDAINLQTSTTYIVSVQGIEYGILRVW